MPISVPCSTCGNKFKAPDSAAGRKAKCPKCGASLLVPAAGTGPAASEHVPAPLPKVGPRPPAVLPPPLPVEPLRDDDEDRPRKRRPRDEDDEEEEDDRRRRRGRDEDDGEEDDNPPRRRRDQDDEDDEEDERRRPLVLQPGASPVFLFIGAFLMAALLVSVYLPWRKFDFDRDMRGLTGKTTTGAEIRSPEVLTLVVPIVPAIAILGVAAAILGAFVPNRLLTKIMLESAFGCAMIGTLFGLLGALLTEVDRAGTERGTWGAWMAAGTGVGAAAMFLLAVHLMAPEKRPRRKIKGGKQRGRSSIPGC